MLYLSVLHSYPGVSIYCIIYFEQKTYWYCMYQQRNRETSNWSGLRSLNCKTILPWLRLGLFEPNWPLPCLWHRRIQKYQNHSHKIQPIISKLFWWKILIFQNVFNNKWICTETEVKCSWVKLWSLPNHVEDEFGYDKNIPVHNCLQEQLISRDRRHLYFKYK
jgi:hypothetical protein